MPAYSGSVALPGLSAETRVWRDGYGTPHIFAANLDDAARALGYLHASERLYQMEINRRVGQGRVAEIAGADLVNVDRFIRTLGLYPLAQSSFAALSPWAQQRLQAYADGVNAFLDSHRNALPPEFLILGDKPEPWTPADSLVWGKLMSLQLSSNYALEGLRARLAQKLPADRAAWLFPAPKPDWPVTTAPVAHPDHAGLDETRDRLGALLQMSHGASNEWVVAGSRSDTGKPILANDPHLELGAPILWYLARIVTPQVSIKGGTVPGLPLVLLGQSDRIAWGLTTSDTDAQDLFVETVDPTDPTQLSDARRRQAVPDPRRDDPRQGRAQRQTAHPRDAARPGHLRRRQRSRRAGGTRQGDRARLHGPRRPRHDRRSADARQRRAQLGRVPRRAQASIRRRPRTSPTPTSTATSASSAPACCRRANRATGSPPSTAPRARRTGPA